MSASKPTLRDTSASAIECWDAMVEVVLRTFGHRSVYLEVARRMGATRYVRFSTDAQVRTALGRFEEAVNVAAETFPPWFTRIEARGGGHPAIVGERSYSSYHAFVDEVSVCFAGLVRDAIRLAEADGVAKAVEQFVASYIECEAFPDALRTAAIDRLSTDVTHGLKMEHDRTAISLGLQPFDADERRPAAVSEGLTPFDAETVLRLPDHHFKDDNGRWLLAKTLEQRYKMSSHRLSEWRSPRGCPGLGGRVLWGRYQPLVGWVYCLADAKEFARRRKKNGD